LLETWLETWLETLLETLLETVIITFTYLSHKIRIDNKN